jgi:flagellar hook-associated protein 1 FlgK
LNELGDIFNETGENTGISQAMNDYWSAWSDVAGNPDGSAERANLIGLAQVLVSRFHSTAARLELSKSNLNMEVKENSVAINNLLKQIAQVNGKIASIEHGGADAGDYRTQRNGLMEDLSQLINYSYFEDDDGAVNIAVGNGRSLVEGAAANDNLYDVIAVSATGKEANVTNEITGGELGGALYVRDHSIPDAESRLDELAYTLATQVNTQHAAGVTLNGTTGVNFFTPLASSDGAARLISIDAGVANDTDNIAAGLSAEPGDNRNANLVAVIRDAKVMAGGTATMGEYFSATVGNIGIEAEDAERQSTQSDAIVAQLETYRETGTGVSIEEEMANLIRYQQAYQAAARVLNAATDIVEVLNQLKQ